MGKSQTDQCLNSPDNYPPLLEIPCKCRIVGQPDKNTIAVIKTAKRSFTWDSVGQFK